MATYTKETALYDTGAIATDIANAGTTATKYITYVDSTNGIRVYDGQSSNQNVNFAQINSNGMQVYKGGTAASNKVAEFGETVQIGKSGSGHTSITSAGMKVYGANGSIDLATIGYGAGVSDDGTIKDMPFYTFGHRVANSTIGNYSVAEGVQPTASGYGSHAEGSFATASGFASHAEGVRTTASGSFAHAEGIRTTASGAHSHAEGSETTASKFGAHAEGENTTASGESSHAEGENTVAEGYYSHAGGNYTIANAKSQTVIGEYNEADTTTNAGLRGSFAFIIGNGSADDARSNALTVDWNGNLTIDGGFTANGYNTVTNRAVKQTINGTSPVQFEAERFGKFIYMTYKIGAITLSASSTVAILSLYSDIRPKYETIIPANITDSNYATVGTGLIRFETGGWVYLVAPKSLSQTSGLYVMFTALYLI